MSNNQFIFTTFLDNNIQDIFEQILLNIHNNINILEINNNLENSLNNEYIEINNSINNNLEHSLSNEYVEFHIELNYNNYNNNNDLNENNYFKSCKEINDILGHPIKIKKNDSILNEKCLVCMDNYKVYELKRLLPNCKHCFHKKCVDKWFKKNASCPICRDKLF
jgi:hypothetical protein